MGELSLRRVSYDHPDAQALTVEVQAFYTRLYGAPDRSPFHTAEFGAPHGAFFVGYLDEVPVVMGGWRFSTEGVPPLSRRPAELKRMYVRAGYRGRGLARALLAALERDAADQGADWLILQTGAPQIAAVKLYRSCGYAPIPAFGYYGGARGVVNLGKPL